MKKTLLGVDKLDRLDLFSLTDLSTKSYYYIKVHGFGAYLKKVLLLIAEVFVKHREAVLFEKDLSEIPELIHPKIGVDIKMGTDNDVPRLRQLLPQYSARIFQSRLSKGDIFFIATINDKIIHQIWISFQDNYVALLNKEIVLKEGEVYSYHAYTAPEFRGNSVYTAVKRKLLGYLKAQGYKRCFFVVDLKTNQLTKAYERISGTDKGAIISYWRILGYRSYRHKPYRGVE